MRSLRATLALGCLLLIAQASGSARAQEKAQEPFRKRIVQQGIAVDLSIENASPEKRERGRFQEGDDILVRFKVSDAASGSPIAKAGPAAWMDLLSKENSAAPRSCAEKVREMLSGSIFSAPELNLNVYYVLALNNDATITVVDPLFGFGGTKLLAMVSLDSPGEDWALSSDESRLFVSMPDSGRVAVIDTVSWKLIAKVEAGSRPTRIHLQPDGQYLWVATESPEGSGVAVVSSSDLKVSAFIQTGRGAHQIVASHDNRSCFVTNEQEGTVSIIDIDKLAKVRDIKVGRKPSHIAYSPLSRMAYAASESDGRIDVIDARRQEVVARIQAEPGLGQIRFAPGGRLGFIVNPEKDVVHILDAAANRIVQTGDMEDGPDQIAFSSELAYVRHRGSEIVLMIPLREVGLKGTPVPVVDFPGGQSPFGKGSRPSLADSITQVPDANAVLVANPADRTIYFYKEGMAAPMGNFSNYSREPRAVLVVNRSLRERAPGVYETTARLSRPGLYDLALFLNTPRVVQCFPVSVEARPELASRRRGRPVDIEPLIDNRRVRTGERARLRFRLIDPSTKQPRPDLKDVRVLAFLAPGIWQRRQEAVSAGDGVYEVDFVPPQPGIYYVYVECRSIGLQINNPQYMVLEVEGSDR